MARHTATGRGRQRPRGFTYVGLLITIALIGVGLGAVGPLSHTLQLREKERELLFVGDQFRRAIGLYYERSPGGLRQYPKKLEDLLRDERYPGVQRYLRRIYVDPLTSGKDWGLVEVPGVGIMGVYSRSDSKPVKAANFPPAYEAFATAEKHSDWKFVYQPEATAVRRPAGTR